MNINHLLSGLLLAAFLLTGNGCDSPQETLPVVRLGHSPHDHHAPLYVAAMNPDYFRLNGGIYLDEVQYRKEYQLIDGDRVLASVLVDSSTGGKEMIRKLSEEQFDISFGGVPAILSIIDKGRPIRIIAPVMAEGAGLVVHRDLPINNWKEFLEHVSHSDTPLKIGYKSAVSVQNLIFEHALLAAGIPFGMEPDDHRAKVRLINLNGATHLIPAMENRLIDGFVVMQPYLALAQAGGQGKTIALLRDLPPEGRWHGHPCCALAANDKFLQDNPEISEALLALILRAQQFIAKQPEKSARQIAQWLGLPFEVERSSLATIDFSVSLDQAWNRGIDFWLDAMVETGHLKGQVLEARRTGKLNELIYRRTLYDKVKGQVD